MDINLNELKSATDEALKISIVKMLVFQQLKSKVHNESTLKNRINSKTNKSYKPSETDLKNPKSFNLFIENLSKEILSDLPKPKISTQFPQQHFNLKFLIINNEPPPTRKGNGR